ncbi:MAG: ComEC family competence protein [Chloroflexi bacterium]|nr:ComEC family competence protein [Chloroflexota bacterium]
MPLVLATMALAFGVWLGSLLYPLLPEPCALPWLRLLHTTRWGTAFIEAGAFLLLPFFARGVQKPHRVHARLARLLAFYMGIGVLLYTAHPFRPCLPPDHVGTLAAHAGPRGRMGVLTGTVVGWPEQGPTRVHYRVRAEEWTDLETHQTLRGDVLLRAPLYPRYTYGDRIRAVGRLREPPESTSFNYRRYLARRGIFALFQAERLIPLTTSRQRTWRALLYALRERLFHTINAILPDPYGALANGILLGIESNIPRSLYDEFNRTGTSHIIVISGFNISIIAALLLLLLRPLVGRVWAGVLTLVGIGLYVIFVGADAAVVRAGLMGMVYASSALFRRRGHVLNSLALSAFLMLAWNPLTLWDVGFQLSFLATLGLIVLYPPLAARVHARVRPHLPRGWQSPVLNLLNEALLLTFAAQLATVPLIIATFGRFSLVSLLTNLLILPVQPLIMIGGGISALAGLLWLPLGRALAWLPLLPLVWTVGVVRWTARWSWASAGMPAGTWLWVSLYYSALAAYVLRAYLHLTVPDHPPLWREFPRPTDDRLRRVKRWAPAFLIPLLLLAIRAERGPTRQTVATLYPGGHLLLQRPPWQVLVTGHGVEGEMPHAAIWILTDTRTQSLLPLREVLDREMPQLVLLPAACRQEDACLARLRPFVQALTHRGIRWSFLPVAQTVEVGPFRVRYPVWAEEVHPVIIQAEGQSLLLPPNLPLEVQQTLAAHPSPITLWPLPLPRAGTWPDPAWARHLRGATLLLPEESTYPPGALPPGGGSVVTYPSDRPWHIFLNPLQVEQRTRFNER